MIKNGNNSNNSAKDGKETSREPKERDSSVNSQRGMPQGKKTKYVLDKKGSINSNIFPMGNANNNNNINIGNSNVNFNNTGMMNYKPPMYNGNICSNVSNSNLQNNPNVEMNMTGVINFKTNDLNLRQYIINKITHKKNSSKDNKNSSLSKDYNSHSKSFR